MHAAGKERPSPLATIDQIQMFAAQHMPSGEAELFVYEKGKCVPYAMQRAFTIHAHQPVERGNHAHKRCGQLLICLAGSCDVTLDDGAARKTVRLERPRDALFVPASIWAAQRYREAGTILMVLCDQLYDEADYIRDYDAFQAWRAQGAPPART